MARISSGLSRAKKSVSTSRREDDLLGGGGAPGKEDEEVRRRVRVAFCVSTTSLVESNEHHVFPIIMYVYARVRSARVAKSYVLVREIRFRFQRASTPRGYQMVWHW